MFVPQPYFVPQSFVAVAQEAPLSRFEAPPAKGGIFLDVQPIHAQIFIDGYYVGTPADLDTAHRGVMLDPGPHRIEISAPGYQQVAFDVRIIANETIAYRHSLATIEAPAPAPAHAVTPAKPTTFYLIPGCYMGNVPPKDARLPATCDLSKAVTFP